MVVFVVVNVVVLLLLLLFDSCAGYICFDSILGNVGISYIRSLIGTKKPTRFGFFFL